MYVNLFCNKTFFRSTIFRVQNNPKRLPQLRVVKAWEEAKIWKEDGSNLHSTKLTQSKLHARALKIQLDTVEHVALPDLTLLHLSLPLSPRYTQ